MAAAWRDFVDAFQQFELWRVLAINDILSRYRGSILGPFWITLSTAAFVAGIALVYGSLMHVPIAKFVPWIATGVVCWNFIANTILEAGDCFIMSSSLIRQSSLPLPMFVMRGVLRNILNFVHQLVVIVVVAIWFKYILTINLPAALAGFVLLVINLTWISYFVAIVAARFRDFQQVIAAVMQLVFFITPIIWIPNDMRGVRSALLLANPFAHLLNVIRNPLIGTEIPLTSWTYLLVMTVSGWVVTFILYALVRRRIVHYL